MIISDMYYMLEIITFFLADLLTPIKDIDHSRYFDTNDYTKNPLRFGDHSFKLEGKQFATCDEEQNLRLLPRVNNMDRFRRHMTEPEFVFYLSPETKIDQIKSH